MKRSIGKLSTVESIDRLIKDAPFRHMITMLARIRQAYQWEQLGSLQSDAGVQEVF